MKKALYIVILLFLVSCKKDIIESPDCDRLKTGLAELNENIVKNEVEKLTADLHPESYSEDPIGHMLNLQTLSDRISSYCNQLTASVVCYACIETYPPISEILVEFEYEGIPKKIVVDIVTSDEDILRFGGLHQQ